MSHTVTVTRTTTTTSTTAILLNSGFFKTIPGLLKLAQVLLGAVCVGLVVHYAQYFLSRFGNDSLLFFLLTTTSFLIGSAIIVISCLLSITTASFLPKTLYELVYHGIAFGLYLAASICLITYTNRYLQRQGNYEPMLAASIIGLINAALYLISTVLAYRTYRVG